MKKKKSGSPIGAQILRRREEIRQLARIHEYRASEAEKVTAGVRNPLPGLIREWPIAPVGLNLDSIIDPELRKMTTLALADLANDPVKSQETFDVVTDILARIIGGGDEQPHH